VSYIVTFTVRRAPANFEVAWENFDVCLNRRDFCRSTCRLDECNLAVNAPPPHVLGTKTELIGFASLNVISDCRCKPSEIWEVTNNTSPCLALSSSIKLQTVWGDWGVACIGTAYCVPENSYLECVCGCVCQISLRNRHELGLCLDAQTNRVNIGEIRPKPCIVRFDFNFYQVIEV